MTTISGIDIDQAFGSAPQVQEPPAKLKDELRKELERLDAEKPLKASVPINSTSLPPGSLMPADMDGLWRIARMMQASGIWRRYNKFKGEWVDISEMEAMLLCSEAVRLGFAPTQAPNILYIVNGKVTIYGDAWLARLRSMRLEAKAPDEVLLGFEKDGTPTKEAACSVTYYRNIGGTAAAFSWTYTMEDAIRAGLTKNDTYAKHTKRMLLWRARTFACRDAFPEVFAGVVAQHDADVTADSFDPEQMAVKKSEADAGLADAPQREATTPTPRVAEVAKNGKAAKP